MTKLIIAVVVLSAVLSLNAHAQRRGFVVKLVDKHSKQPITAATVVSLDSTIYFISDSLGRVFIPNNVPGFTRLRLTMIGYKKIIIPVNKLLSEAVVNMEPDAVALESVLVTDWNPNTRVKNLEMGSELVSSAEAKKIPGILGEADIVRIMQLKPGIKNAGEGLAGFYVRGGGADQNLILLDGVPVYNPNHLLGMFSIFNNDAIRDAKLYKSAYPSRFGGRLSSVLDISSRQGSLDSFTVSGGTGLLSSRLTLESPISKGKSSFIVSARRTYFDIFTRAMNRVNEGKEDYEEIPSYFFSDINLRSDWKINPKNTLWATGYWGGDNFSSNPENFSTRFKWGNTVASVNLRSVRTGIGEILASIFHSGYRYRLGNRYEFNDVEIKSAINTSGSNLMFSFNKMRDLKWQVGLSAMVHQLTIGDYKSSSELSGFRSGETTSGNEAAAYVNTEWDAGKRIAFSAGLRVSVFNTLSKKWYVNPEPRVGARLNVGDNSAIKASYTRMSQYLHQASLSTASMPVDMWYPSTSKTLPQYSDQLSVGWSSVLANSLFFSLEGYCKWMNNQVEFRDGASVFGNPHLENDFVFGRGNAYGIETYLEKKTGRTTGWIGYTLSRATRTFDDIDEGTPFKPRYDRRHDVSLIVIHKINRSLTLSGTWIYGSGAYTTVPVGRYMFQDQAGVRPRSIIPVYTERGNYQLQAVHRLDINMIVRLKSKKGEQDITFSVYNAYSRRNPFYIQFKELDNKEGYVTAIQPTLVSLFPVLPGITYNFKF